MVNCRWKQIWIELDGKYDVETTRMSLPIRKGACVLTVEILISDGSTNTEFYIPSLVKKLSTSLTYNYEECNNVTYSNSSGSKNWRRPCNYSHLKDIGFAYTQIWRRSGSLNGVAWFQTFVLIEGCRCCCDHIGIQISVAESLRRCQIVQDIIRDDLRRINILLWWYIW